MAAARQQVQTIEDSVTPAGPVTPSTPAASGPYSPLQRFELYRIPEHTILTLSTWKFIGREIYYSFVLRYLFSLYFFFSLSVSLSLSFYLYLFERKKADTIITFHITPSTHPKLFKHLEVTYTQV